MRSSNDKLLECRICYTVIGIHYTVIYYEICCAFVADYNILPFTFYLLPLGLDCNEYSILFSVITLFLSLYLLSANNIVKYGVVLPFFSFLFFIFHLGCNMGTPI